MKDLSKLTLKGYFEQLRNDVNQQSVRKGSIRATGSDRSNSTSDTKLLELLIKAVALMEEIHGTDADFLQSDHISDYRDMINTLNLHGIDYRGKEQILTQEALPKLLTKKKPMQKATSKKKSKRSDSNRKAG